MMPQDQTILEYVDGGPPTDDLRAAIATLVDLPAEGLPNFAAEPNDDWRGAVRKWAQTQGLKLVRDIDDPGFPCVCIGDNPRELGLHAVVWDEGAVVHDPHPSRMGLTGRVRSFLWFDGTGTPEHPPRAMGMDPCPFCGHRLIRMSRVLRDGCRIGEIEAWAYYAICCGCACHGGWGKSEATARRCWNARVGRKR